MDTSNNVVKEGTYQSLINKCHEIAEDISKRTKIMQSEVECVKEEKPELSQSQLERELQQLRNHLQGIKDSIVV